MKESRYYIQKLNLQPHPEGGYFKETYRSTERILKPALPERFSGDRNFSTSIFYLLERDDFSAFHKINQDEIWHFYDGASLTIHVLHSDGRYEKLILGREIHKGEHLQIVVPALAWFGAEVNDKESYTLAGCTVAPGFDFADFAMPSADELTERFPQHKEIINKLTR